MKTRPLLSAALAFSLLTACELDPVSSEDDNFNSQTKEVPGTFSGDREQSKNVTKQTNKQALSSPDFSNTSNHLNTDFLTFGIGNLRDVKEGAIEISGISGDIIQAFIYWHGIKPSVTETNSLNVNGTVVIAENLGYSDSNCWGSEGYNVSQTLKANITALVESTRNGIYELKDFGDLNPNGASIVVFFNDGDASNNRDVTLLEGNDSNIYFAGINDELLAPEDPEGWAVDFPSFSYDTGSALLQLHVGDGQNSNDGTIRLNSEYLAGGFMFDGALGAFWDINSYEINSFLTSGENSLSLSGITGTDCLSLVLAIVNVPTSASNNSDSDGDGLSDEVDNCPLIANPDQIDTDADGYGDVCDPDDDNDGVLDGDDNCPLDDNSDQSDYDLDGLGNVCDPDDDNDGVLDDDDETPFSEIEATVSFVECSTSIENKNAGNGNTMSDELAKLDQENFKNKGQYKKTVAHLMESWVEQGLITEEEKNILVGCSE